MLLTGPGEFVPSDGRAGCIIQADNQTEREQASKARSGAAEEAKTQGKQGFLREIESPCTLTVGLEG